MARGLLLWFAPIVTTRCPLIPQDVYLYENGGIKHQKLVTGLAKLAEMGWSSFCCV